LAMADAWLMLGAQRIKHIEPILNKQPLSGTNSTLPADERQ
jgi:hypothetical protein